jgi:hypothetical protein
MLRVRFAPALFCAGLASLSAPAQVIDAAFAPYYTAVNLGSVPGVPGSYGGLTFAQGSTNTLLIGGSANNANADIYAVRFTRDTNQQFVAFECGPAEFFANAVGTSSGIDGGLTYGPDGILFYTTYSDHTIGQLKPGSVTPDRITPLGGLGISGSVGAMMFVPEGFPGEGRLKIASYNTGFWYDTTITPAGDGTFLIDPPTAPHIAIGGGPEGIVYIAGGNPGFPVDSVLVSEYGTGRVVTYEIDANGDPIIATRRVFMTGLSGAEGAAIDPLTGEFFFSTFGGGDRVVRVTGFTSIRPPGDMNCDGLVTVGDIAGFVLALTNPAEYASQYPNCDMNNADMNQNGSITVGDIGDFVRVVTQGTGCDG